MMRVEKIRSDFGSSAGQRGNAVQKAKENKVKLVREKNKRKGLSSNAILTDLITKKLTKLIMLD